MGVVSGMRCNEKIQAFYTRLLAARKAPKVAIVACMRKLLYLTLKLPVADYAPGGLHIPAAILAFSRQVT
jgi:hypothetical protein